MLMNRRGLLISSLALSTLALSACVTNKNGSTTSLVLDVSKIKAYGNAGLNAAATIASALSFVPSLAATTKLIHDTALTLNDSLNKFIAAAGSNLFITYDSSNYKSIVDTLSSDLDRVLLAIEQAVDSFGNLVGVDQSALKKITLARDALATIVSVFSALIGTYVSTASGPGTMTESEALSILNGTQ